jgi:hypothetical protein
MDSGATLGLVEKHISRHLAVTGQIHSQSGPVSIHAVLAEAVGIPVQLCVFQTAQIIEITRLR